MGPNPEKAVALYARVSTLDQNCDVQLEELRRYASKRFASYHEYTDAEVSGVQRHRPQLDNLMKDARKRRFDGGSGLEIRSICAITETLDRKPGRV